MPRQRWWQRWSNLIDQAFFVLAGVSAVWLAYLTLAEGITPGWQMLLLIVFWVLVAYLVLPRVHRILTGLYLPDYFIGRTRTADGLLGDPVNLALTGSEAQVHAAMQAAGWSRADDLSFATGWRIVADTLRRRSYPEAPVSPLLLFRRRQDFAYQQEISGSPSKRHHVRFWRCPPGWLLPGGFAVDWLAAGTYDRSVGLSLFTFQITHKIDADIDAERDHVIETISKAHPEVTLRVLEGFSAGYHSRNGGGDVIATDGDLPIVELNQVPAVAMPAPVLPPVARRPAALWFAVATTALRGLSLWALAALLYLVLVLDDDGADPEAVIVVGALALFGLIDVTLSGSLLRGRSWARQLLGALSLWSISVAVVSRAVAGDHGPLHLALVPLAVSVLLLLAISSEPVRRYRANPHRDPDPDPDGK